MGCDGKVELLGEGKAREGELDALGFGECEALFVLVGGPRKASCRRWRLDMIEDGSHSYRKMFLLWLLRFCLLDAVHCKLSVSPSRREIDNEA